MDNPPPSFPPSYPPQYPPPLPPDQSRLRPGAIARDVAIFWGLTLVGGFVIGFVNAALHPGTPPPMVFIALSNLVLGLVAFTIAGSLVPPAVRWQHLGVVALIAWLSSLVNVFFFHATLGVWLAGAIFIVLLMVLGGALSYLFNRGPRPMV